MQVEIGFKDLTDLERNEGISRKAAYNKVGGLSAFVILAAGIVGAVSCGNRVGKLLLLSMWSSLTQFRGNGEGLRDGTPSVLDSSSINTEIDATWLKASP